MFRCSVIIEYNSKVIRLPYQYSTYEGVVIGFVLHYSNLAQRT